MPDTDFIKADHLLIKHSSRAFTANIVYSPRRRSVGISVKGPDDVRVRAPVGISKHELSKIVSSKAPWILRKILMWQELQIGLEQRTWSSGEDIPVLGKKHKLEIIEDYTLRRPVIRIINKSIEIRTPETESKYLRRQVFSWYVQLAAEKIEQRLYYFAKLMRLKPGIIRVKNHKSRWGSCSGENNLNFNWRLVMAPPVVLDYVIIHELGHIKIKNHSDKFWSLVEKYMPDYAKQRRWLRENGHLLEI